MQQLSCCTESQSASSEFQVADAGVSSRPFPPRNADLPAESQGLFEKFNVVRVDGSDAKGSEHFGCRNFVLDATHDPFARPALLAYAAACTSADSGLADALIRLAGGPVRAGAGCQAAEEVQTLWVVDTVDGHHVFTRPTKPTEQDLQELTEKIGHEVVAKAFLMVPLNAVADVPDSLFTGFKVCRVDGSDSPGRKHHGCQNYVIDATHDPFARPALLAYSSACEQTHPDLAAQVAILAGGKTLRPGETVSAWEEQVVWIVNADDGDHVLMHPKSPSEHQLLNWTKKVGKQLTAQRVLLWPAPLRTQGESE